MYLPGSLTVECICSICVSSISFSSFTTSSLSSSKLGGGGGSVTSISVFSFGSISGFSFVTISGLCLAAAAAGCGEERRVFTGAAEVAPPAAVGGSDGLDGDRFGGW